MARLLRVPEHGSPEGILKFKLHKLENILRKAEKLFLLSQEREKQGNLLESRIYKKRARDDARMAMKLMGILMIEYGVNVSSHAERARKIALATRTGATNGTA